MITIIKYKNKILKKVNKNTSENSSNELLSYKTKFNYSFICWKWSKDRRNNKKKRSMETTESVDTTLMTPIWIRKLKKKRYDAISLRFAF